MGEHVIAVLSFWTFVLCGTVGLLFQIWPVEFGRRCCDLAVSLVSVTLPKRARDAWRNEWNDTVGTLIWEGLRKGTTAKGIGLTLIGEAIILVSTGWPQRNYYRTACGFRRGGWRACLSFLSLAFSFWAIVAICAAEIWIIGSAVGSGITASIWGSSVDGLVLPMAMGPASYTITQVYLSLRRGSYSNELSLESQRDWARRLMRSYYLCMIVSIARFTLFSLGIVSVPAFVGVALIVSNRILLGAGLAVAIGLEARQWVTVGRTWWAS